MLVVNHVFQLADCHTSLTQLHSAELLQVYNKLEVGNRLLRYLEVDLDRVALERMLILLILSDLGLGLVHLKLTDKFVCIEWFVHFELRC